MQESRKISGLLATLFIVSVHCTRVRAAEHPDKRACATGCGTSTTASPIWKTARLSVPRHGSSTPFTRLSRIAGPTGGSWPEPTASWPRALYQQARYAEAEPLAKWALSVRVADRYARPEAVFQCLFTLGAIDSAQQTLC